MKAITGTPLDARSVEIQIDGSPRKSDGETEPFPDFAPSADEQALAVPRLPPLKFVAPFEFDDIPPTEFVYRDFYARGYTSLTIAAPKVGKSMLSLAEAIDMATGGKVFGVAVAKRRVAYVCAEDDQNVLYARCAATCLKHIIKVTELAETLVLQSGVDWPELFLISTDKARHQINEPVFDHLEQMVRNLNLDVIILDPLQDLSHADESNEAFRALGQRLRLFDRRKVN
jgi:RecA-family ATPase